MSVHVYYLFQITCMYCYINLQYALMEGHFEHAPWGRGSLIAVVYPLPNEFIETVLTRTEIKSAILKQTT